MNTIELLQQKEVHLLEAVNRCPSASQRLLSTTLGLSLGQINSIIKTLVQKGDLETVRHDGRRVEYVITKRGYARWIRYTRTKLTEAFHHISEVKKVIGTILDKYFDAGIREFVLEGENATMASIVGEVFRETLGSDAKLLWGPAVETADQVVLKLDGMDPKAEEGVVNLLHELANPS